MMMVWLFILALIWTFVITLQTKSVVNSQYLRAIGSEIAICVCWFISLDVIITSHFKLLALVVYTTGCVIGVALGMWVYGKTPENRERR